MKGIFLISFFFVTTFSYSQNPDSAGAAAVSFFKNAFSEVPTGQFSNLVPFASNGKWGYLDRSTRKIVVKPLMQNPEFFNPDIKPFYNGVFVDISGNGNISIEQPKDYASYTYEKGPDVDDKVRRSSDGFKGFTASISGELINYSDLYQYNTQGIPGWNIQLFQYKNQYYGIVKNKAGSAGIIDSKGNPLKGFDFNFNEIIANRGTKDTANAWFFVKKNEADNFSLISTNGAVKNMNEIFNYPLLSTEIFGYTPYIKGDSSAIFDRYEMKWIIKPQTKIKIQTIEFSSKEILTRDLPKNRNKVNIYYLVVDKGNSYFVDMKGKKYLPL